MNVLNSVLSPVGLNLDFDLKARRSVLSQIVLNLDKDIKFRTKVSWIEVIFVRFGLKVNLYTLRSVLSPVVSNLKSSSESCTSACSYKLRLFGGCGLTGQPGWHAKFYRVSKYKLCF